MSAAAATCQAGSGGLLGRRVVHIATRHRHGGAERALVAAVEHEVRAGAVVEVVLGRDSDGADFEGLCDVTHVRELVRAVHPWHDVRALRTLRRIIGEGRWDVVQTHQSKAGVTGRIAARGSGAMVVHNVHMASFGPGYPGAASAAYLRLERLCASSTDLYVSVGEELVDRYVDSGIGTRSRYVVVRSPARVEEALSIRSWSESRRLDARRELGLGDAPVIAAIGSLERRKRHTLVMTSLAPLLREGGAQLVIAGEGPERLELERIAERLGVAPATHFVGYVDPVFSLLACTDVLVHASRVEGVSQVVLQALAAGVGVVATEVEGLSEMPASDSLKVVSREGGGLIYAVREALRRTDNPAPPSAFLRWTGVDVTRQRSVLIDRIAVGLEERR